MDTGEAASFILFPLHLCAHLDITCAPGGILGFGRVRNNWDLVELQPRGPLVRFLAQPFVFLPDRSLLSL